MILIGIDPGTKTGLAVWDTRQRLFLEISTLKLHQALDKVFQYASSSDRIKVIFEDARQRKWFGDRADKKIQGAGSVKRDSSIWEEFLTDHHIEFWAKPPVRYATKMEAERFKTLTGWTKKTSNHARDAAMLVWGG